MDTMIGPYAIQQDYFDERAEYFLRISTAMNYATEQLFLAKKRKDVHAVKFWTDMHRPLGHACRDMGEYLYSLQDGYNRYCNHLRKINGRR